MNVICIEEEAFYLLIEQVVMRLQAMQSVMATKWIDTEEAMRLLNIKSKTTLQEYRDRGKIRFSQPRKRVILYDRDSIHAFLEENARETF
ncbi:MAG: helix-turn-helix domain-containing protein [Ignavibacteriae bacterium]|nr:helix-turn-helix domain-containing protein [Ignavibacteriota bacterium]MCB9216430.1 helix-turn-helix domain-containing protein [Ignavibacteria bacterium]